MGNKLSCSCAPLIKKAYRVDETSFRPRREGRLWAEVFHVSAASGAVRWQQVSEDLVPVNIKCIQDQPDFIFKITAYNSQVEKILDVVLAQPGTRLGQASECFVYWKDTSTGDTWGLNFTSPLDAKQFRELCSPSFKSFQRKASSSYSLRLNDHPSQRKSVLTDKERRRKPQSTPSSPSRRGGAIDRHDRATTTTTGAHHGGSSSVTAAATAAAGAGTSTGYGAEELQCTCMTAETLHRQRNGRVRYTASATLPKTVLRQDSGGSSQSAITRGSGQPGMYQPGTVTTGSGSTSVTAAQRQQQQRSQGLAGSNRPAAQYSRSQYAQSVRKQTDQTRSMDSGQMSYQQQQHHYRQQHQQQLLQHAQAMAARGGHPGRHPPPSSHHQQQQDAKSRSKSSDDVRRTIAVGTEDLQSDLKKLSASIGPGDRQHYQQYHQQHYQQQQQQRSKSTGTNTGTTATISLGQPRPGSRSGAGTGTTTAAMRPTSVPAWSSLSGEQYNPTATTVDRSRIYRSEIGRRRSLERAQGFDLTDLSPTSDPYPSDHTINQQQHQQPHQQPPSHLQQPLHHQLLPQRVTPTPSSSGDEQQLQLQQQLHQLQLQGAQVLGCARVRSKSAMGVGPQRNQGSPTIKVLQEYEQHLRNALAKGTDADTYSLNTFETMLSQSMDNVVVLLREVQSEIEAIRREESHYRSSTDEAIYTHHTRPSSRSSGTQQPVTTRPNWSRSYTLPSRGTSLPPANFLGSSTGDLYHALRKSSAPILDTLSVDGHGRFGNTLRPQSSFESTGSDGRAYLTSSEMSDDERLSLTTAISDEDDGETRDSPYRAKSGAAAAAFQCTGAVRKAGFLSVKKWLLRKRNQIKLARKRGWKGYWVCLKGTTLLFYPCDARDGRAIESTPRHLIIIDGAIMQPIPEHPKRDFIFCLSTAFGDAYLFQAPCQVELENWIAAIHNSCGAAFARHRGKSGALHLLQEEISRLDRQVEQDMKLKHMTDLQLSVVADPDSRRALNEQIRAHEESLEQNHCEQFRLRCYSASIQTGELPNPKTLLAHVSKSTKLILNRLGVFTVSSFHAYICARSPSMLTNVISGRGNNSRRRSTGGITSGRSSATGERRRGVPGQRSFELSGDKLIKLMVPPDENVHTVYVKGSETVEELLWSVMTDRQLSPPDYFLRLIKSTGSDPGHIEHYVPMRHEQIDHFPVHDMMEILPKILYQVELTRVSIEQLFGFSVEAELVESDHHNQDELCVYVSRVEDLSLASSSGLTKGDEIMVINGAIVSDLDMMYIESVLQEELSLCMMLRSCRTEAPEMSSVVRSTDEYIESLVCPPPPTDGAISDEMIGKLIVPSPHWNQDRPSSRAAARAAASTIVPTLVSSTVSGDQIAEALLKTAEELTSEYCPNTRPGSGLSHRGVHHQVLQPSHSYTAQFQVHPQPTSNASLLIQHTTGQHIHQPSGSSVMYQQNLEQEELVGPISSRGSSRAPLSDAEKLRKVIRELVDTERTYVEHLNSLLEIYLEPMKAQNLVSEADICALFGNIQEIVAFQRLFLQSLEEGIAEEEVNMEKYEQASQFRSILFAIGDCFIKHAETFKLYSSFCASHSKAQEILHPSNESLNPNLADFLNSRSRGQQAYSLESYLIKPIQRILKYPLLLQQLKSVTDSGSDEHKHLAAALKGMERVAEHINEMQRIHEEYGAIFDHLQRQHYKSYKNLIDLSPVELLYYGGVDWVNIPEFLGKIKKGLDLHAMCFVFNQGVVFLCKEKIRQKKKIVGTTNKLSEVEIIRYQVLIPVSEVQVRSSGSSGRDSQNSNEGRGGTPLPGQTQSKSRSESPSGHRDDVSASSKPASGQEAGHSSAAAAGPSEVTSAVPKSSNSQFIWDLIHLRCTQISGGTQRRTEKVYQLSNSTNEFRNAFLRTIRQIIRESVRNMAVPISRPVSRTSIHRTLPHKSSSHSTASQGSTANSNNNNSSRQTKVVTISYTSKSPAISSNQAAAASSSGSNQASAHSVDQTASSSTAQQQPEPVPSGSKGKKGSKEKPPPPPRDPKTTKSTGSSSKSSLASSASSTAQGAVAAVAEFPPPPSPLPSATEQQPPHSHSSAKEAKNCSICSSTSPAKDGKKDKKSSKRSSSTEGSSKGAKSKLFSRKSMPERDKSFEIEEE